VRGVNEHIRDLALLDVYGRVARTLLRLAKETDEGLMTDAITQQEIANMVGASREMVSRVLNNLKSDGYISVSEKRIKLISTPPLSSSPLSS
jgi:CRP/FNR family cyclic AMP-dependent transcriptional regulator